MTKEDWTNLALELNSQLLNCEEAVETTNRFYSDSKSNILHKRVDNLKNWVSGCQKMAMKTNKGPNVNPIKKS